MHAPPGRDQIRKDAAWLEAGSYGRLEPFFGVITRATTVIPE
jgi:hypothetical protein